MQLNGYPTDGIPSLSYIGAPTGSIVGSLVPPVGNLLAVMTPPPQRLRITVSSSNSPYSITYVPNNDVIVTLQTGATVNLPSAVNNENVYLFKFATEATGLGTVGTVLSQTIDGSAVPQTLDPGDAFSVYSDNTNWRVF